MTDPPTYHPITWSPTTRAERNGLLRFDRWAVVKTRNGRAMIAPLDADGQPMRADRLWINQTQIAAGVGSR